MILRCWDFYEGDFCCSSCHEDDDQGYCGLLEISPPKSSASKVYGEICCAVSNAIKEEELDDVAYRSLWAAAIVKQRKRVRL
jgi:hypothetical protein